MNRLAIISGFLGGIKNRYMTYQEDRPLAERFRMASNVEHLAQRNPTESVKYLYSVLDA